VSWTAALNVYNYCTRKKQGKTGRAEKVGDIEIMLKAKKQN